MQSDIAFGIGHRYLLVGGKTSVAGDDFHVVLFQEELDALAHSLGNTAASGHNGFHVGLCFAFHLDAVVFSVFDIVINLRTLQQCFGGDAAPVKADAAQLGLLDHGYMLSQL